MDASGAMTPLRPSLCPRRITINLRHHESRHVACQRSLCVSQGPRSVGVLGRQAALLGCDGCPVLPTLDCCRIPPCAYQNHVGAGLPISCPVLESLSICCLHVPIVPIYSIPLITHPLLTTACFLKHPPPSTSALLCHRCESAFRIPAVLASVSLAPGVCLAANLVCPTRSSW